MSNAIKTVNVERNDTLTRIASRNSVSLEALLAANPQIRNADALAIGQPVHIPLDQPPSQPAARAPEAPQQSQTPAKQPVNAVRREVLPGTCACGRDLTLDELAAIFPTRRRDQLDPFLAPMNRMMAAYGIDSCLRKAHALAQIGHESGSLRYRAEVLPRGVTEQEAYAGYKGRGLIQITFKDKYQEYGRYKGMDFLGENRLKLETVEYATDSAGWFWNFGSPYKLNDYADKNDLILISTVINGGFNGFDDRAAIFRRAHKALRAAECKTAANRSPDYLPFERSKAYDTRDMAFAWGLWSDPASSRHGLAKDPARAKAGYLRFLELNNSNPIARRRFGFKSTTAMIDHARERSR